LIWVRISEIGFGVGLGVGVGRTVGLGANDAVGIAVVATAAVGDAVGVITRPGTASHATQNTSTNAARALIVLG